MEQNKTAVEWLREKVQSNLSEPMSPKFAELFDMATQMEREQIISAVDGFNRQTSGRSRGRKI